MAQGRQSAPSVMIGQSWLVPSYILRTRRLIGYERGRDLTSQGACLRGVSFPPTSSSNHVPSTPSPRTLASPPAGPVRQCCSVRGNDHPTVVCSEPCANGERACRAGPPLGDLQVSVSPGGPGVPAGRAWAQRRQARSPSAPDAASSRVCWGCGQSRGTRSCWGA